MKKLLALCFALGLCTTLLSFSSKRGGDIIEIYFNGKQVLQQFVHLNKGPQTLQLRSLAPNDRIDVLYSHCGQTGTNRVLAIRNEKNELIKELKFANNNSKRFLMSFSGKDIPKNKAGQKMKLYYSSKELPEGKMLAVVTWSENKVLAKL
jgi:hypothetical protein